MNYGHPTLEPIGRIDCVYEKVASVKIILVFLLTSLSFGELPSHSYLHLGQYNIPVRTRAAHSN